MYNSQFDCPPGKGVGCQPVHEVLSLIVEKETEEDLFASTKQEARRLKAEEKQKRKQAEDVSTSKKLYLLKDRSGDKVLVEVSP